MANQVVCSAANFAALFSPDRMTLYTIHEDYCLVNNGPTILQACKMCGVDMVEKWIGEYLEVLLSFIRNKPTHLREDSMMPAVIVCNYGDLKVTSYMLFISRAMGCRLGKFYANNIEPHDVLGKLAAWKEWQDGRVRDILRERYYAN